MKPDIWRFAVRVLWKDALQLAALIVGLHCVLYYALDGTIGASLFLLVPTTTFLCLGLGVRTRLDHRLSCLVQSEDVLSGRPSFRDSPAAIGRVLTSLFTHKNLRWDWTKVSALVVIYIGTSEWSVLYLLARQDYLTSSILALIGLASLAYSGKYFMRISMHTNPKYKPLVIEEEQRKLAR